MCKQRENIFNMLNLRINCPLRPSFEKVDWHTGDQELIHGTMTREQSVQLQGVELPKVPTKGVHGNIQWYKKVSWAETFQRG